MSTRAIWLLAVPLMLSGYALIYLADDTWPWRLLAFALIIMPMALAVNLTATRRRAARREDSTDSIEHHAAVAARSDAFGGSLLVGALLILGLMVAPGPEPWLWAAAGLLALLAWFWVRYQVRLDRLRG